MKDGASAQTLRSRVVRQAAELIGTQQLADRVNVSRAIVHSWLAGTVTPPPRAFRKMLYLLRKADPAYRPLEEAG
jgi:DNA-binding transcriptional regulator YiaG